MNEQPPVSQDSVAAPAPEPIPTSIPPQTQQFPQPGNAVAATPLKKRALWPWIVASLGLLLIIGGTLLYLFIYPVLQAKAVATGFMGALKTADNAKIKELSGEDATSPFFVNAEKGLKDASYSIADSTKKDTGYVINFNVTGSASVKDTTVVVKDGKVTSLLLNTKSKTATSTTPTASNSTSTCLTAADITAAGFSYSTDDESLNFAAKYNKPTYLAGLYFMPDSTSYNDDMLSPDDQHAAVLDRVAKVYTNSSSKDFTYTVYGFVHETTSSAAGVQLANARAGKVKDELTTRGVPASRITIGTPANADTAESAADIDRKIEVDLFMPSSCAN